MKQTFDGFIGRTMQDTVVSYKTHRKQMQDTPNIIYIVLDDMGFADLGCYGSEIHTPNIDSIAASGLRYNNFHTTAICSATRASLLTGANHHAAGVGAVVHVRTGCPNGLGHLDPCYATVAEVLREYDYRTFLSGKWHLTNQTTQAGPFDDWPLAKGFERFYGYLPAMTDQYHPRLTQDNTLLERKSEEGYHLSEDLTDHAIEYVYTSKLEHPEQPFFLYLAYGAVHFPHHVPKEYADRYQGVYDQGWDVIREQRFQKQKELGIIPADAELNDRNALVKPWETLNEKEKKVYARHMEMYAGFLEHTDEQIGRLLAFLKEIQQLDNTLIVFLSDNGTESGGGQAGHYDMTAARSITDEEVDVQKEVAFAYENLDQLGTEQSNNLYPMGWAQVGNTPFPWYKTWTYEGGVRDPLIISYPDRLKAAGEIRTQYVHVSDIMPTVLEVLGIEKPDIVKGVPQKPMTGISFAYTFDKPQEPSRKRVQYYEMLGNRSIYKDGWKATVNHAFHNDFKEDTWELYHVEKDFSEKYDVAEQYPEKLQELRDEWLIEAGKNGVFPLLPGPSHTKKDMSPQDMIAAARFSEERIEFKNVILPYIVTRQIQFTRNTYCIRADITRKNETDEGVIVSLGHKFQGFTLYVKENHIHAVFTKSNLQTAQIHGKTPLSVEQDQISLFVKYDEKTRESTAELYVGKVLEGKVTFISNIKRGIELCLAANPYSAVSQDYETPFAFQGIIKRILFHTAGTNINAEEELQRFFDED